MWDRVQCPPVWTGEPLCPNVHCRHWLYGQYMYSMCVWCQRPLQRGGSLTPSHSASLSKGRSEGQTEWKERRRRRRPRRRTRHATKGHGTLSSHLVSLLPSRANSWSGICTTQYTPSARSSWRLIQYFIKVTSLCHYKTRTFSVSLCLCLTFPVFVKKRKKNLLALYDSVLTNTGHCS